MIWILRSPEGEGEGGGEATQTEEAPADLFSQQLNGDQVPENYRGKTVQEFMEIHQNLLKSNSKMTRELNSLKKKSESKPEPKEEELELDNGVLVDLSGAISTAVIQGKLDEEQAAELAPRVGLKPSQLQKIARMWHDEVVQSITNAGAVLSQEMEKEVNGLALVHASQTSGLFTPEELAGFDLMLEQHPKSIEPYRIIAARIEEAGYDVSQLQAPEANKQPGPNIPNSRVPLQMGTTAMADPDLIGFRSRREYLDARAKAAGDKEAERLVEKRLKQSQIQKWTDRTAL